MGTHVVDEGDAAGSDRWPETPTDLDRLEELDGGAGETARDSPVGARRPTGLGPRGARPTLLDQYLQDIAAFPLISRDEEIQLARRIRAGDHDALEQLVRANLRFVITVAKPYQHHGIALADLINEGNLGLIRAAHRFDETRGIKFISYAVWWIRQAIQVALAEQGHLIRVPMNRAGAMHRIAKHANVLRQALGREPTAAELAEGLGLSEAAVADVVALAWHPVSLDGPRGASDDTPLIDSLADAATLPDASSLEQALADVIRKSLARLEPREVRILRLYFGLDTDEPMNLAQIGDLLGITRERVRQIKEKALAQLRQGPLGRVLADFR